MIPAGYVNALVAWATRPDLSAEVIAARKALFRAEQDALVTGQVNGGKALNPLTSATVNGKSFTWALGITQQEKLVVVTDVLERLGLLAEDGGTVTTTYAGFANLER